MMEEYGISAKRILSELLLDDGTVVVDCGKTESCCDGRNAV